MWRYIVDQVEFFTLSMGFVDTNFEIFIIELIISCSEAVTRLTGINRFGAIGKSVTHAFKRAGRGKQFW